MQLVTFEITGTSPLLMHNPAGMARNGSALGTKKIPKPEDEARAALYEEGGDLWFPAQAFKAALVSVSKGRRLSKRAATGVVKGSVFPAEERCWLIHPETGEPLGADDYEVDIRRVVVQRSAVFRARPKITRWATKVAFDIDPDVISPDPDGSLPILLYLLNIAGRTIGVGDFRPECGGPFGRFEAELL